MSDRPPPPLPALESTFDVAQDCEGFEDYIKGLRRQLRDPTSQAPPLHPDLYPLRPTTRQEPRQWLRLTMVAGNDRIILWIRTDNLYVVGFEQVRGGARFEFGRDPRQDPKNKKDRDKIAKKKKGKEDQQERRHLIPDADWLGFEGNYDSLGQPNPVPTRDTPSLPDFGYSPLEQAIHGLAEYTREAPGAVQDWLRTIVITISESLRLHNVCRHIGDLLRRYVSGWVNQHLMDCIHDWGDISACVIASATNPEIDARELYSHLTGICENTDEACELVAILNTGVDPNEPGPSNRHKREAIPMRGLTFVEIFSAVVHGSTGRNSLYGHITVDDGLDRSSGGGSSQVLFLRGRPGNAVLPSADDQVVKLVGPARAVWGYGEAVIRVDVMNAIPGAVADMTADSDEVGSGKLVWNTYDTPLMVYDEVEEYIFEGVSGNVNVRCAVITNAVVATVGLRWLTDTGSGLKEVYGSVSAATAKFDKVTVFDTEWNDAVSVGAGWGLPLLRKVVVVPLGSPLTIWADLWTRAQDADMSVDDRIASGAVAVFEPRPFGPVAWKKIGDGDVEVNVTWSLN